MRSCGSYQSSQSRYSVLAEKPKLSSPLWGAVSQKVYTDTVPPMANVLTFTPSSRVLVSIKTEPVQRQAWIKRRLFSEFEGSQG